MLKTSKLIGPALDWAVAKCLGLVDTRRVVVDFEYYSGKDPVRWEPVLDTYYSSAYSPSTIWSQGGPIIERERIGIRESHNEWHAERWADNSGMAKNPNQRYQCNHFSSGPTPLIAAMRCFVASRLGDAVEVPDELN